MRHLCKVIKYLFSGDILAAYKNAEHYDQHHHKSWQGHLQAVLRSTEKTGPVTVTFTADGCAPAILHLSAE